MTSMTSTIISEPFQLYLSSNLAQKKHAMEAVYTTLNPEFPRYATVTAQSEGIHIWDLRNLHSVASYSIDKHIFFAIPAFSLYAMEEGTMSVVTYALIKNAPALAPDLRGRTIWMIRQSISGSAVATSEKTALPIDVPPVQMCGTGHDKVPLLFVSKNGGLFLLNAQVDIKSQLDWPGEREHVETFVFRRELCTFIQNDTNSWSSIAIACCQSSMTLHVRLVLLGEEIVPAGTCEIPIASSTSDTNIFVSGLTCSSSGVLSFIDSRGIWATYQLLSLNSSLVSSPISENLHLQRFSMLKNKRLSKTDTLSVVSLGTSLVLLAALVEGTEDISLQIWDLSYGVLLTAQSMPVPSAIPEAHLRLAIADQGQVLLTVSPSSEFEKFIAPRRSSIHIVPVDPRLKSNIATALRKMALTAEWLKPKELNDREPEESAKIISSIKASLKMNHAQNAEQAFLKWVNSRSSKEAALRHVFVKKILNIVLSPEPPANYPYTPRITRCLLENAVVSTIMLNGRLITMLRQRGDWENLMFALTTVTDVSEDELMASAKFLIDRQRRSEDAMDVDALEGYVPALWSYLFACVSYPFSTAPMRLAIRKYIPDAQDLVVILEILENWMQGGTEREVEDLLKSFSTNTEMASSPADSPPYPKIITFLHALLDASFVALLQHQPSHGLLRRILSYIEPEIMLTESLEPLRGVLESFVKTQSPKEKRDASKECPTEWKKRKRELEKQASLNVGLYRLEELAF